MKLFKTRIAALCGIMLLSGCAGETSVPSKSRADSPQLSDSENESASSDF